MKALLRNLQFFILGSLAINTQKEWLIRWNEALMKLWDRFLEKEISESNLKWMERNHHRLMKLSERKMKAHIEKIRHN